MGPFPSLSVHPAALSSLSNEAEANGSLHAVLFPQATFKGWMDIMYAAVDSRGVSAMRASSPIPPEQPPGSQANRCRLACVILGLCYLEVL